VQVNPKIDWTFAKALRAFLRADPDVIMVGEIRDRRPRRSPSRPR
jgi:type II secretory ATPase GspE/PulE/Tfp pilus assembly ATPase PilB-like protein